MSGGGRMRAKNLDADARMFVFAHIFLELAIELLGRELRLGVRIGFRLCCAVLFRSNVAAAAACSLLNAAGGVDAAAFLCDVQLAAIVDLSK